MTGRGARPDDWAGAVAGYLDHLRASGATGQTVALRRYHLTRIGQELAARSPWDASYPELARWLGSHGWRRETIRSHQSTLRGFYGWAHAAGYIDHDPARLLPRVKAGQVKPRPAPEAVIDAALELTDGTNQRVRLMLELGSRHGMRRTEIAAVHTDDVFIDDVDQTPWLLVHGKGDKEREVPLTAYAYEMLSACPAGQVFPGRYKPEGWPEHRPGFLSPYYVARLMKAAMGGEATSHQLRHRFATTAYRNSDHDVLEVSRLLGHASIATTQRYLARDTGRARRVLESADTRAASSGQRSAVAL